MRKQLKHVQSNFYHAGSLGEGALWLCLEPERDRLISVLSDNATIIQASRLQHSCVFINRFFFCSLFGGTGTRRVRALRSSKNASIFEPTERRKYLLIRQINRLLPRWVVRVSKTEWLMGPCIWVEAYHQRIEHSNKVRRRIKNWEVFLFGSGQRTQTLTALSRKDFLEYRFQ